MKQYEIVNEDDYVLTLVDKYLWGTLFNYWTFTHRRSDRGVKLRFTEAAGRDFLATYRRYPDRWATAFKNEHNHVGRMKMRLQRIKNEG